MMCLSILGLLQCAHPRVRMQSFELLVEPGAAVKGHRSLGERDGELAEQKSSLESWQSDGRIKKIPRFGDIVEDLRP